MEIALPNKYCSIVTITNVEEILSGIVNVEVELLKSMGPRQRGKLLRDLEDDLCANNRNIRIWHKPLGDKNSLRTLRGVKL